MTITERVLAYLKKQPGSPVEIAEALSLHKKHWSFAYHWGRWSFGKAENAGLIEWKDGKWYLKEAEV